MGTKKYESDFDHFVFWHWARQKSIDGYKVLVTEYNAPDDFKCIWQAKKKDGMGTTKTGNKQNTKIEKLFVLNP
jgi:DNA adenine methylase